MCYNQSLPQVVVPHVYTGKSFVVSQLPLSGIHLENTSSPAHPGRCHTYCFHCIGMMSLPSECFQKGYRYVSFCPENIL